MNNKKYEFVVVGSGAGGVTVARELTKRGKEVLVIERGTQGQKIGSFRHALEAYDMTKLKIPKRIKRGGYFVAGSSSGRFDRTFLWKFNSVPGRGVSGSGD